MPTYVAFLRAINVTGRFVKMQALAEAFHAIGHAGARTFIHSGNVVFTARARSLPRLAQALEDGLAPHLGFRTQAFVRSADEVRAIAARAGELRAQVAEGGEVNVCLLQAPLDASQAAAIRALVSDVDDFAFGACEVYLLSRVSQSHSRFSNAVLERTLKARSTLRRASMLAGLVDTL